MFGARPVSFGPAIINLSIILLGLLVLVLAIVMRLRGKKARFFEVSFLLFLVGLVFGVSLFWFSYALFGFRWISDFTFDGLILWFLLVTILSVLTQTFFFVGILFNMYLSHENGFLLAIISVAAFQTFTYPPSLPWVVVNIVGSTAKIVITYKTRNIYGAALMGIIPNLIDVLIQVL